MAQPAPSAVLCKLCFGHACPSAAAGSLSDTLIEKYIATATSWLSGFLHSHSFATPYPYSLASTADKSRGSLTHYPTHRAFAKRSFYSTFPVALGVPYFDNVDPISKMLFVKAFAIKNKTRNKNRGVGISTVSFYYTTSDCCSFVLVRVFAFFFFELLKNIFSSFGLALKPGNGN